MSSLPLSRRKLLGNAAAGAAAAATGFSFPRPAFAQLAKITYTLSWLPTGQYAYVIKNDNTVERRQVEVATVQDGTAVITKGLSPGEKVVVSGQYRLTVGARVRVAQPDAAG